MPYPWIRSAIMMAPLIATSCASSRLVVTPYFGVRPGYSLYDPGIAPSDFSDPQACWKCRGSGFLEQGKGEVRCTACRGARIER